jgi:hypothetical protein
MQYIRMRFLTASRKSPFAAAVKPMTNGLKVPGPNDVTSFIPDLKGHGNDGAQYSHWLRRLAEAEEALLPEQWQAVLDFVDWRLAR